MDSRKSLRIVQKAISTFGFSLQIDKTIKELSELLLAVIHYRADNTTLPNVVSEIVDVEIMLEQYKIMVSEISGQNITPLLNKARESELERLDKVIKHKSDKRRRKFK